MSVRRLVPFFVLSTLTILNIPSAFTRQAVPGSATISGETVSFAPAAGLLDAARSRVSVAFTTKPLPPEVDAASRRARQWDVRSAGPSIVIDFDFTPGSTSALEAQLTACRVVASGYKAPLELKGTAKSCHVLSIGGLLRAPGALIGLIQGQGATYSLRLPFSLTFEPEAPPPTVASVPPTAPASAPSVPANSVFGSGSYDGQRMPFTRGIAAWNAGDSEVRIALFDHAVPAAAVASLLSGVWSSGGPNMTLHLRLRGGVTPAAVTYCYVELDFPSGGPMSTHTDGKGCGVTEIGGTVRAGGSIAVRLAGQAPGPRDKPFSWDARFNLLIAR